MQCFTSFPAPSLPPPPAAAAAMDPDWLESSLSEGFSIWLMVCISESGSNLFGWRKNLRYWYLRFFHSFCG